MRSRYVVVGLSPVTAALTDVYFSPAGGSVLQLTDLPSAGVVPYSNTHEVIASSCGLTFAFSCAVSSESSVALVITVFGTNGSVLNTSPPPTAVPRRLVETSLKW